MDSSRNLRYRSPDSRAANTKKLYQNRGQWSNPEAQFGPFLRFNSKKREKIDDIIIWQVLSLTFFIQSMG